MKIALCHAIIGYYKDNICQNQILTPCAAICVIYTSGLWANFKKRTVTPFHLREWRGNLGRGHTATLDNGALFERAGVNYSAVSANKLPPAARKRRITTDGGYQAAGVSVVAHPQNPYCPTAHMNVRAFVTKNDWWFGGGMDLTPYYGFDEDCRHFHNTCKTALNALNETLYPAFKKACDEYFFIPHRNEARGIGGVFFDDYNKHSFAHSFALMRALGDVFLSAYLPILEQRRHTPFGKHNNGNGNNTGAGVMWNLICSMTVAHCLAFNQADAPT